MQKEAEERIVREKEIEKQKEQKRRDQLNTMNMRQMEEFRQRKK